MEYKLRKYPLFSACGLNCGLCPNFHLNTNGSFKCPGCAGDNFSQAHPSCGILSCCQRKVVEYCCECEEFPCKKYDRWGDSDSFITHRNYLSDMDRAKLVGIETYINEQNNKSDILRKLLKDYNDGRRKSFYCLAVNLLEMADVKMVLDQLDIKIGPETPLKERAVFAASLFNDIAEQQGISLKMRKPGNGG